jgi:CheY-like chemotaxis protein
MTASGCNPKSGMAAKILFADDDPLMHRLYQRPIEQAGFELVEAVNGREALAAAAREKPLLAVVDVMMPETDGLSVLLELKKAEATKAIPVILISGDPTSYRYKDQFVQAGAAVFLSKPFGAAQLLQVIQRLLGSSPPRPQRS